MYILVVLHIRCCVDAIQITRWTHCDQLKAAIFVTTIYAVTNEVVAQHRRVQLERLQNNATRISRPWLTANTKITHFFASNALRSEVNERVAFAKHLIVTTSGILFDHTDLFPDLVRL